VGRARLALLATVISLVAASCHLPDWRGPSDGPRVAALGDSLLHQLQHGGPTHPDSNVALTLSLIDEGWQASVRGENGWTIQWVRALSAEAVEQGAEGIILVTGTNDVSWITSQRDREAARQYVRAQIISTLREASSVRCVVWPTIANPSGRRAARTINETLRAQAERRRNLRVPEWGRMLRVNPQWIGPNGLHLSEDGEAASQGVLLRAMRSCLGTEAETAPAPSTTTTTTSTTTTTTTAPPLSAPPTSTTTAPPTTVPATTAPPTTAPTDPS